MLLDPQMKSAIKQYLTYVSFDLIIYSTPPITMISTLKYLKSTHPNALFYLMLKDIFPQNAVDLELFSEKASFIGTFAIQERKLYRIFDKIGTMSKANTEYLLRHNPEPWSLKLKSSPNAIQITEHNISNGAQRFRTTR